MSSTYLNKDQSLVSRSTTSHDGRAPAHRAFRTPYEVNAHYFIDFTRRSQLNERVRLGFTFTNLPKNPRFLHTAAIAEKLCCHCAEIEATRPEHAHPIPCIVSSCATRCLLCIVADLSYYTCIGLSQARGKRQTVTAAASRAVSQSVHREHRQERPRQCNLRREDCSATSLLGTTNGQEVASAPPVSGRKRKVDDANDTASFNDKRHNLGNFHQDAIPAEQQHRFQKREDHTHVRDSTESATIEEMGEDTTRCETNESESPCLSKETKTQGLDRGETLVDIMDESLRKLGYSDIAQDMMVEFHDLKEKIKELRDAIETSNAENQELKSRNAKLQQMIQRASRAVEDGEGAVEGELQSSPQR